MFPPGYHCNVPVAIHALRCNMSGYTLLVPMYRRVLKNLDKDRNLSGHN